MELASDSNSTWHELWSPLHELWNAPLSVGGPGMSCGAALDIPEAVEAEWPWHELWIAFLKGGGLGKSCGAAP